jgi:hypothetical protein
MKCKAPMSQQMGRNKTRQVRREQGRSQSAETEMKGASQKLRSLARQSRALACTLSDRQRVEALQSLARLYDKQAEDFEAQELA